MKKPANCKYEIVTPDARRGDKRQTHYYTAKDRDDAMRQHLQDYISTTPLTVTCRCISHVEPTGVAEVSPTMDYRECEWVSVARAYTWYEASSVNDDGANAIAPHANFLTGDKTN